MQKSAVIAALLDQLRLELDGVERSAKMAPASGYLL
jgi:hypothetical protein